MPGSIVRRRIHRAPRQWQNHRRWLSMVRGLGRDTLISLRGLCIAGGLLVDAQSILLEWANAVSEGILPNRLPDAGDSPDYNSIDAFSWYIAAMRDFLRAATDLPIGDRHKLEAAVNSILSGYSAGTRYGIHADSDGLLSAGAPGVRLIWMDAKMGDWVVTLRIGKAGRRPGAPAQRARIGS